MSYLEEQRRRVKEEHLDIEDQLKVTCQLFSFIVHFLTFLTSFFPHFTYILGVATPRLHKNSVNVCKSRSGKPKLRSVGWLKRKKDQGLDPTTPSVTTAKGTPKTPEVPEKDHEGAPKTPEIRGKRP